MTVSLNSFLLIFLQGTEREYFVEHSILHPDYNPDTVDNDVALLRIPSEGGDGFSQSQGPDPSMACLPEAGERLPGGGSKCTIIGWGKEKNSHVYGTDVLHQAEVRQIWQKSLRLGSGLQWSSLSILASVTTSAHLSLFSFNSLILSVP